MKLSPATLRLIGEARNFECPEADDCDAGPEVFHTLLTQEQAMARAILVCAVALTTLPAAFGQARSHNDVLNAARGQPQFRSRISRGTPPPPRCMSPTYPKEFLGAQYVEWLEAQYKKEYEAANAKEAKKGRWVTVTRRNSDTASRSQTNIQGVPGGVQIDGGRVGASQSTMTTERIWVPEGQPLPFDFKSPFDRVWKSGKHEMLGSYWGYQAPNVILRKETGSVIEVPLERLDDPDKDRVQRHLKDFRDYKNYARKYGVHL